MSAGYTQEQDGSRSMRRLLALYYSLLSGALLLIGALYDTTAGIYGGLGCALVVLVLLGLTTISDIKGLNYSGLLNGSNYPVSPDTSSGVKMGTALPELRQNSDTKLTDLDGKVDKVSTTMTGANTSDEPGSYEYRRLE
jgi:hypothetical protein